MKKETRQLKISALPVGRRWPSVLLAGALLAVPLTGCGSNGGAGTAANAGSPTDSVATVGGQAIKRADLDSYLETVYGEGALQQLIDYELVQQKLKASGLDVTDAEVDTAMSERAKQNPQMAEIVKTEGPRKQAITRGIRNELAVDKLLTKDIKVTDQQLQQWFQKNHARYDQPERVKMGILAATTKVRADTMAQQLKAQSKTFKQLVDEQGKANDAVGQRSQEETEYPLSSLPPNMKMAIAKLKPNDVTPVLTLGAPPQAVYVIVRLVAHEPAQKADFAKLKSHLELDYKMEQVMMRSTPPGGQAGGFQAQQPMQQAAGELLARLHSEAGSSKQVQVTDPAFDAVAKTFEAAANAPVSMGAPGGAGMSGGAAPSTGAPSASAPSTGAPKANAPKTGAAGGAKKPGG